MRSLTAKGSTTFARVRQCGSRRPCAFATIREDSGGKQRRRRWCQLIRGIFEREINAAQKYLCGSSCLVLRFVIFGQLLFTNSQNRSWYLKTCNHSTQFQHTGTTGLIIVVNDMQQALQHAPVLCILRSRSNHRHRRKGS